MNTSESVSKIAPALLTAQMAITFAAKDATNPHFKSKYADLPTVIDAVKPALNAAGIVFLQMPAPSDPGTLALSTRLMHSSGEWIESTATAPLQKNDPQGYGSAITYLRRYGLASAVGLYQDDDDGHAASQPKPKLPKTGVMADVLATTPPLPADEQQYIQDLAQLIQATFTKTGQSVTYDVVQNEKLEADQMMYLWAQLPSNVRSGLKAEKVARERKSA